MPLVQRRGASPIRRIGPVRAIRRVVQFDQGIVVHACVGAEGYAGAARCPSRKRREEVYVGAARCLRYPIEPRLEFGLRGRAHRSALQPQAFEWETGDRLRQGSGQGGVEGEVQRLEVGQTRQCEGHGPAQVVVLEVQFGHAPVRIGSHAIPFAQGRDTQPVCLVLPVRSARPVVERRQGVPLRIATISVGREFPYPLEPFLEFHGPRYAHLSFHKVEVFERESDKLSRQGPG